MNETNGGLYLALMNHMGRKEDAGAFAFISTESGPFMTMVTFGVTGLAAFPWETLARLSSRFYSAVYLEILIMISETYSARLYPRSSRFLPFRSATP